MPLDIIKNIRSGDGMAKIISNGSLPKHTYEDAFPIKIGTLQEITEQPEHKYCIAPKVCKLLSQQKIRCQNCNCQFTLDYEDILFRQRQIELSNTPFETVLEISLLSTCPECDQLTPVAQEKIQPHQNTY